MSRDHRQLWFWSLLVAAIGTGCFAGFVVLYPTLFAGTIVPAHPDNFREAVERALANGEPERALRIAGHAVRFRVSDPDAFAVYGRVLVQEGRRAEAVEAFETALRQTVTPPPEYRPTRRPFYHAEARLELGRLAFEEGHVWEAIGHFELAQAGDGLFGDAYAAYREVLYRAYVHAGLWARALSFGEPSDDELAGAEETTLLALAQECEGAQKWHLAQEVGEALLAKDGGHEVGHYLLGRVADLEDRLDEAVEHLSAATAAGHPYAPFFRGVVEEANGHAAEAADAYLRTAENSLYRPFAVAKALELMAGSEAPREALGDELDGWFERGMTVAIQEKPSTFRDSALTPVCVDLSRAREGWFPVLLRWRRTSPSGDAGCNVGDDGSITLARGEHVLHLQWVVNAVPSSGNHGQESHEGAVYGWVGPQYDLGPPGNVRAIADASGEGIIEVVGAGTGQPSLLWSIPAALEPGMAYLCAGRMKVHDGTGYMGWQFADRRHRFHACHRIISRTDAGGWTWGASYATPQYQWMAARVQIGVDEDNARAHFDDLMILQVQQPE